MTDEAFFQRLLYNAYMGDAITLGEVLDACKRLSIPVPHPSEYQNEHKHATLAVGMCDRPISSETHNWQAIQGQQPEAILAH